MWVPVALEPGGGAFAQLASQLAIYLGAPGYGEMFSELGFAELVQRTARARGVRSCRAFVPRELFEQVCALGSAERIAARVSEYHDAGADIVGVAPSTAEDRAGQRVLTALVGGLPNRTANLGARIVTMLVTANVAWPPGPRLPQTSAWSLVGARAPEPGGGEFRVLETGASADSITVTLPERRCASRG